jgi:hypothetical protein
MSGNTQFDLHPGAESLNAFAEHALAEEERERIAAHLAMCGRCREIAFLAQGAAEEMTQVAATTPRGAERERWYKNWRLTWIPAAALAASVTVAYVIHVQRIAPGTQIAKVERQAAPAIEAQQKPAPPPSQPAEAVKGKVTAEKRAPASGTESLSPKESSMPAPARPAARMTNGPLSGKENALHVSGRATAELESAPEEAVKQKKTENAEARGEMQALAANEAAPVSMDKLEPTRERLQTAAAEPAKQAGVASRSAAPGVGVRREIRGAMVSPAASPIALPGGSAVVSTANAKGLLLAVNEAGNLYLSSDMGAHWESIVQQWGGRAVSVRTAVKAKTNAGGVAGAQQGLFELVNDQGKVWVSADGKSWKTK